MNKQGQALLLVAPPVFFDASGKRWRRIIASFILLTITLIAVLTWVTPAATAPIWTAAKNASVDYPRKLIASSDDTAIPLVGEENGYMIDRIALVERRDDKTYLTDPFSNTIFREATTDEIEEIGDKPYVIETFGRPADRQLMLTFDDGPDSLFTPMVLDLLSREGVPSTFFTIGVNIVENPDVFKRIIREGHMVANHTFSHINFSLHDDLRNREEIIGTDRIMRATGQYASRLFRIPTGDPRNNPLALLQAQQLGYAHIDMDVDPRDWSYSPGEEIPVPQLDGKGHIVLLHDAGGDRTATVKMLEEFIHQAKAQGYTFGTLASALPPEYTPQKNIIPESVDHFTAGVMTTAIIIPARLLGWLFWFGVGSLTIMSTLYVVLALISRSMQKKKTWKEANEKTLPLVSVILPVFNESAVVRKTLDTLKSSDYPNLEVIAVNDGSTDNTLAILNEYARQWPLLKVVDQENGGKSVASNTGITLSRGEIIITLDGDTLFEPQTIRMLARHFTEPHNGKRVGAVAGHVKVGNRRNILTAWQSLEYISGICVTRMAEGLVGAISIAPGACAAWRREAFDLAGGYSSDTLAEDADLTLAIQRLGYSVVQENDAVAWTEAPMTIKSLAKQRLRWTFGNLQAIWKHSDMLFRARYGALGLITLPYALLSIAIPLLFMPMTIVVAGISIASGNWQSIALFAAFVAGTHMIISIVAVLMVRESLWHLLVVPIYRLIYEPLRAYVLYGAILQALKGRMVGWYRPERTNSVVRPVVSTN
jgi:cellulose synthase/poly-beta-1,6-N-acetylglucosamine synthase-like glycosyltransferase/peptidoglycan/xylan/chitin deacetylase (PgdA/CDA1 family)